MSSHERMNIMANSFLRAAYNRVIEARERQASRYVNDALMNLDDTTLRSLGTSRDEIRRRRANTSAF